MSKCAHPSLPLDSSRSIFSRLAQIVGAARADRNGLPWKTIDVNDLPWKLISAGGCHAEQGKQRIDLSGRRRDADGNRLPPVLAARPAVGRAAGAGLRPPARAAAWRGFR